MSVGWAVVTVTDNNTSSVRFRKPRNMQIQTHGFLSYILYIFSPLVETTRTVTFCNAKILKQLPLFFDLLLISYVSTFTSSFSSTSFLHIFYSLSSVFPSELSWFAIRSLLVQESSPGCRYGVSRAWTWSQCQRPCTAASTPGMPTCCSSLPQPLHTTYTCGWVRDGAQNMS